MNLPHSARRFVNRHVNRTHEPTLVMLHGLLGDRHDWARVAERLEGISHLALDLPGHGDNRAVQVGSFEAFHEWLSATLSDRGIVRYCLLGYSLGGRLALYHASRQPPGLAALWLENAHPGLPTEQRPDRIAHDERWAARFAQEPLQEVLADWYRQPVFADLGAAQRRRQRDRRRHNSGQAVARMLRATSLGCQPSLWQWLADTSLPVGYLSGLQDAKFHALANRLAATAPHIHHAPLEGGHNLHSEQPDKVARQLDAWYRALR
ncbi:2-succinyl-6-hydroxy-2,4-cyclohexadiene-1-carboxylate synthase [Halomonas aquamarina]|uniref:2-succinyl-6-hydroxy-2, 4-cyclohexadiene-1-carboxylate synthase n=1 Tax=Vreelandella aquamarina TaxID=77097 RepID=A0ACC5VWA7_9GAMM|nr:2-succinyl-6-hydroxy-2,4-cyclohexadiene-1-carboxylate synthase [Halomonas aquamarina]